MSMPPRSRTGSGPLVAGLIILIAAIVVVVVLWANGATPQSVWDSFFPVEGATPATDRGRATRGLYDFVFYIAMAIFFAVEGVIVYSAFRYRRKPGDDELPPQIHGNNLVEIIWTIIPTVIVAVLFVFSWQTLNTVDASTPSNIRITAVAQRFQWSFDYLDPNDPTGQTVLFEQQQANGEGGGLVLPVGVPVHIDLRSKDVIHAFYVPMFLFKRDVVPGKDNNFDFTVEEQGTYRGQCAELCGPEHGAMLFEVHAVDMATYQKYVADMTAKAKATPPPAPSGQAAGPALQLSAQNIQFSTAALEAKAGAPFAIDFNNEDKGVPHNVAIKDAGGNEVFKGDVVTGPVQTTYAVPALKPGTYEFMCSVHPSMTGTLTVN